MYQYWFTRALLTVFYGSYRFLNTLCINKHYVKKLYFISSLCSNMSYDDITDYHNETFILVTDIIKAA